MRRWLAVLLVLPQFLSAQQALVMRSEAIAPGFVVVSGFTNGNILARLGPEGTVLVDAQSAKRVAQADSVLRGLNAPPVRLVLLTHYHSDHVGGNPYWKSRGARIVGHANLAAQMRKDTLIAGWENWHRTPEPVEALPDETFTDGLTLRAGGEEIRLVHIPAAHTDGDAIVWFPAANILHTGDLLEREAPPFIDWWTGGRLEGMLAGVDWVLEHSDSATRIVPGHGTVARRADVVAYRQMLLGAAREAGAGTRAPDRFTRLLTVGLEQFEPAGFRLRLAPGTPEARLPWLIGCWQFTRGELTVTEHWRVRADGALEGQGRSVRGGPAGGFRRDDDHDPGRPTVLHRAPTGPEGGLLHRIGIGRRRDHLHQPGARLPHPGLVSARRRRGRARLRGGPGSRWRARDRVSLRRGPVPGRVVFGP